MNRADCRLIGTLAKLHGYKGEYQLMASSYLYEDIETRESVFVEVDGLLVPFFISSIRITSDTTALIGFDDLDSPEEAKEFVGCKVFVFKSDDDEVEEEDDLKMLEGYTVIDKKAGVIGKIANIVEYSKNLLFEIRKGKTEILVPVSDSIITKVNHKKREVHITAPDGLLDLNA